MPGQGQAQAVADDRNASDAALETARPPIMVEGMWHVMRCLENELFQLCREHAQLDMVC